MQHSLPSSRQRSRMSDTSVAIRQQPGALTGRSSSGAPPAPKLADPLDSPDFDAVKFLNEMFPTGGHGSPMP